VDQAPHLLIVEARYYDDIGEELFKGAEAALTKADASFECVEVPGAFEIPAAIRMAVRAAELSAGRWPFDGFVTLGCVIRGETSHYDYVCAESARKLQDLACEFTLALGYGILTCDTREQAWARAQVDGKDKGGEAARACLAMIELKRHFQLFPSQD
jgi:6,7-dimethyl-8-ribityllumazine synthase